MHRKHNSKSESIADTKNTFNDQELSFSVYISKGQANNLHDNNFHDNYNLSSTPPQNDIVTSNTQALYPNSITKWIDSSQVANCQICKVLFTFLVRKHHCRACGGIFCWTCCNKTIKIPSEYINIPKETTDYKQSIGNIFKQAIGVDPKNLVCNDCYSKITNLTDIIPYIKICEYVDILTLHVLTQVNRNF